MSNIRFRLAKPSDAKQIADCHWHVRDRYTQGIFLSLGLRFLRSYYKVILNDPYEIITCAENENGTIVGFSSATLDARKQAENLNKHKYYLGLSALSAIILNPRLLKEVWARYKSLDSSSDVPKFVHDEGARGEYWCWRKNDENALMSAELDKKNVRIAYLLGAEDIYFEVDKFNKSVYNYHLKVNKAIPLEEIKLPDGRERVLFKHNKEIFI